MRLIDADALANWIDGSQRLDTEHDYEEVERYIEECPTIDAVPVTRCKDCRFYEVGLRYDGLKCMVCGIYPFPMSHSQNDYCSYGERKGGDE